MRYWLWKIFLGLGLLVTACYLAIPSGPARDVAYFLVGMASAGALVAGVSLHRPARRAPWLLMAVGLATWSVGDGLYSWQEDVAHVDPFPSIADAFYLAAYPILALGMLILIRGRRSGRDRDGLIDTSIFTVALTLISWVFLMRPTLGNEGASMAGRLIGTAYPMGDVLLLGLLVRLLTMPGSRTAAYRLLASATLLLLAADVLFDAVNLVSEYDSGAIDMLWLASYTTWGAAALHPSMRQLSVPTPDRQAAFTRRRLVALCVASLTAPGVQAFQEMRGAPTDVWAFVISSVILFLLVIARMSGLLNQLQDQAGTLADLARTDPLTGLPNRRTADAELERMLAGARRSGVPVAVALLDLDHFKRFNDTFGHQAGDRLLVEAAQGWHSTLRGSDLLARYGGEEFLLLLSGESARDATAVIERLATCTPLGQTFSAGVAAWDGLESPSQLIYRSDVAMYESKRAGRNRVTLAAETQPPAAAAPTAASA